MLDHAYQDKPVAFAGDAFVIDSSGGKTLS